MDLKEEGGREEEESGVDSGNNGIHSERAIWLILPNRVTVFRRFGCLSKPKLLVTFYRLPRFCRTPRVISLICYKGGSWRKTIVFSALPACRH